MDNYLENRTIPKMSEKYSSFHTVWRCNGRGFAAPLIAKALDGCSN